MTELCDLSAVTLRRMIGTRKASPVEILDSCLARIRATDPAVNAMVAMDETAARAAAMRAEQAVMDGASLGLLHGLPIGIKDLQATKGLRTTWGSLLYEKHVPSEDEPSVANIRAAGGVILGKTNTPEFGAGANTRNRVYGATGNPFDPVKTCAGSSGGSAVALACGQVPLASGSDYGGSLRTPAGFCGIVGFRPSPGLVPAPDRAAQLMPWGVSGPMGRSVADAYLLLTAQLDVDRRDVHSSADALRMPEVLEPADLASVRAAFSADLGCAPMSKEIADIFQKRVGSLEGSFAALEATAPDFSGIHFVFDVFRAITFVSAHAERLANHRDKLDTNVIDNTERGLHHTMAEVAKAHVEQTLLYRRVMQFFENHDVLIAPAASVSPFPHAQHFVEEIDGVRMENYMRWLTIAYAPTMALCCSAVIPCGRDRQGMPFGIQIIGRRGSDARVLSVALALEEVLGASEETRRPLPDLAALAGRGAAA
jgi:amidase